MILLKMVGLGGLEPPTSHLSGAHSNQLSYRPIFKKLVVNFILYFGKCQLTNQKKCKLFYKS